jgi:hypothetical protein
MSRERWRFTGSSVAAGWGHPIDGQRCYTWRCDNPSDGYRHHIQAVATFWPGGFSDVQGADQ